MEALHALALSGSDKIDAKKTQYFSNFLSGYGGDDTIAGGRQADTLDGGVGNDSLKAANGDDQLLGGAGNDILRGGKQNDTLIGGSGDDTMSGEQGINTFGYMATSLNMGDVAAGNADTILDGKGDRIEFAPGLEAVLTVSGGSLSALSVNTALPTALGANTNIAYTGTNLQIDIDGNGAFAAATDFQVSLAGVAVVTYDAAGDVLLLA
jgi:Ca2+-binding RTX toxin-like protein